VSRIEITVGEIFGLGRTHLRMKHTAESMQFGIPIAELKTSSRRGLVPLRGLKNLINQDHDLTDNFPGWLKHKICMVRKTRGPDYCSGFSTNRLHLAKVLHPLSVCEARQERE
jgi:hypothetical protein